MATYYLSTSGNNGNAGDIDHPWATWQYGFTHISAGDTLIIRGGTYYPTPTEMTIWYLTYCGVAINGISGSSGSPITVQNYTGETPILDCSSITSEGNRCGIMAYNCDYWYLKGLSIKSAYQYSSTTGGNGIWWHDGNNNTFELVNTYDNGGTGLRILGESEDNLILNCDTYENKDPYSPIQGNDSDGFEIAEIPYRAGDPRINTIRGCRAWNNSDDGIDLWDNDGITIIDKTWCFRNGVYKLDNGCGSGIKIGESSEACRGVSGLYRTVSNCICAENDEFGFTDNEWDNIVYWYNNVSYNNVNWIIHDNPHYGFEFYWNSRAYVVRNNISWDNEYETHGLSYSSVEVDDHNTWDAGFSVSNDDFQSLDVDELLTARQSDGSLPVVSAFHLASDSALIGAGIDVGLTEDGDGNSWGDPPSLGAFEYFSPDSLVGHITGSTAYVRGTLNGSGSGLINDIIAYWSLDETTGTNVADAVGNNDGTTEGATTNAVGKISRGVNFSSSSDDIMVDQASSLLFPGDECTITMWARWDSLPSTLGHQVALAIAPTGSSPYYSFQISFHTATNYLKFTIKDVNSDEFYAQTANSCMTTSTWYFIACVCRGTGSPLEIYINNSEVVNSSSGNYTGGQLYQTDQGIVIGNEWHSQVGAQAPDGIIDEVGIWHRALSTSELSMLYNSGDGLAYPFSTGGSLQGNTHGTATLTGSFVPNEASSLTQGILAWWNMNETSGTVYDHTSNGVDLTPYNSPTYGETGILENGIGFSNDDAILETSDYNSLNPSTDMYAVSLWVNIDTLPSVTGNEYYLFRGLVSASPYENVYIIIRNSDNRIYAAFNDGSGEIGVASTNAVSISTWYHIVFVINGIGDLPTLYVNNSAVNGTTDQVYDILNANQGYVIGNAWNGSGTNCIGVIDEVGVWDRTLTVGEVSELYNAGDGNSYPFGLYVLNRPDFSLVDVISVVEPTGDCLTNCFADAVEAWFDPIYEGDHDRLTNFRNYGAGNVIEASLSGSIHGTALVLATFTGGSVLNGSTYGTAIVGATISSSGGTYCDWWLPSYDEVYAMYSNLYLYAVGNFSGYYYWTSSEVSGTGAYLIDFSSGTAYTGDKQNSSYVYSRACRSFITSASYSLRSTGPAGGWIFYIYDNGNGTYTYYEASITETLTYHNWSNVGSSLGTTSTAIGEGLNNSNEIVAQVGHTDSAALHCLAYCAGIGDYTGTLIGNTYGASAGNKGTVVGEGTTSYISGNTHGIANVPSIWTWAILLVTPTWSGTGELYTENKSTWDEAHDATASDNSALYHSADGVNVMSSRARHDGTYYYCGRVFICFNLSSLSGADECSAIEFFAGITSYNAISSVYILNSQQATSLVASDFDAFTPADTIMTTVEVNSQSGVPSYYIKGVASAGERTEIMNTYFGTNFRIMLQEINDYSDDAPSSNNYYHNYFYGGDVSGPPLYTTPVLKVTYR